MRNYFNVNFRAHRKYKHVPKKVLSTVHKIPQPPEVVEWVKEGYWMRYWKSIGELYEEYEKLTDDPIPLEAFWVALIKLLKPRRVWLIDKNRLWHLTERDYFDPQKWNELKQNPCFFDIIETNGIPTDLSLLPRIYSFSQEKWHKMTMWWERNIDKEYLVWEVLLNE